MKLIHKTDQYLKGKLEPNENDQFTSEIVHDYFEKNKLKKHWGTLLNEHHDFSIEEKKNNSKKGNNNLLKLIAWSTAIAASLLFVFSIFLPSETQFKQLSTIDQLLEEHYAKPLNRTVLKGTNETAIQRVTAFEFYNSRDYNKAIPILESFIVSNEASEDDYFYLGLSYLYNKEPGKAIAPLQAIFDKENTERKDATTWYLALALVANSDCEKAKPYLESVASWKGNKGKLVLAGKAKKLLDAIEKEGCDKK